MNIGFWKLHSGILLLGLAYSFGLSAADIAPPKISVVDEFGVNLMSGQINTSLETVSIGGEMGVAHNISGYTNHFSMIGWKGYMDKFDARSRYVVIEDRIGYDRLEVFRIHDFESTVDFKVMVNGVAQRYSTTLTSNYYYEALGDTRHTLSVVDATHLAWTKPNGTVVRFYRGTSAGAWADAQMEKVTYPNGFALSITFGNKVITNTGFGIKYLFVADSRPMDPNKVNYPGASVPQESPLSWSMNNPKYVQAVNFAVENCLESSCNDIWPKATFTWPGGMPRSFYFGDSTFSVQDAKGLTTEYYFRSFDLAYTSTGVLFAGATPNKFFSPRLIGIKAAGSTQKTISYEFKTDIINHDYGDSGDSTLGQDEGIITGASGIHGGSYYDINRPYNGYIVNDADSNVLRVIPNLQLRGTIKEARFLDGVMSYEESYRNFPLSFSRIRRYDGINIGGGENYHYDARGNIDSFCDRSLCTTALYPATCVNPKTCNQATWIKDPKLNQTTYTYHEQSGQVATITYPANKNGISKVTRYTYEQKRANYYQAGVKALGDPIWLKTIEKTCNNTSTAGDACAGNASVGAAEDETIIRYEYEHDNLLLSGVTVTAMDFDGVIKTKRTCYKYDVYGNRIGETQPKAGLTSCNP